MSMAPELFRDILLRCDQELFHARQKLKYCGFFGRRERRDQLLDWTAYSIQTLLRAQSYVYTAASCDTHPKDGDVEQAPLVSGAVPKADAQPQPPSPSE